MILSKSDFILWGMGIKVSNITPEGTELLEFLQQFQELTNEVACYLTVRSSLLE